MGLISEETLQRILDANDIVEVIGGYFPLKRAGANFRALCPFHTENTPSFNVNPQRQIYHCFGCGAGGDAIRFVMEYEGLPFPEAARKLADRGGIAIEEEAFDPEADRKRRGRTELLRIHRRAAEWFHKLLFKDPKAQLARDYLRKRGIDMETARRWQLGFAPEQSSLFLDWARNEEVKARRLVESGLAAWRDEAEPSRGLYARFRNRLMFPIANDYGEVIAFSGRVLLPDQGGGKYINSPETPIFNKSRTFYGLHLSKRPIIREGRAIICEGQLDLIACFENGIENVVAPLGTAFTDQHARLLKRHCDEAVLCYDSDNAGQAAAEKTFRQLAQAGMMVRVASLPQGTDPDSLLQDEGPEAFRRRLEGASEFFEHLIESRSRNLDFDSLRERAQLAQDLSENVALVSDQMLQDSLVSNVSVRLQISADEIRRHVDEARKRLHAEARRGANRARVRQDAQADSPEPTSAPPLILRNRTVRFLCQLLLTSQDVRLRLAAQAPPDFLHDVPESGLLSRLWSGNFDASHPASVTTFVSTLDPPEQALAHELLSAEMPAGAEAHAEVCLLELERESLRNRIAEREARLRQPGLPREQQNGLLGEVADLRRDLESIKLRKTPAS